MHYFILYFSLHQALYYGITTPTIPCTVNTPRVANRSPTPPLSSDNHDINKTRRIIGQHQWLDREWKPERIKYQMGTTCSRERRKERYYVRSLFLSGISVWHLSILYGISIWCFCLVFIYIFIWYFCLVFLTGISLFLPSISIWYFYLVYVSISFSLEFLSGRLLPIYFSLEFLSGRHISIWHFSLDFGNFLWYLFGISLSLRYVSRVFLPK